jgi:hypothetical protein
MTTLLVNAGIFLKIHEMKQRKEAFAETRCGSGYKRKRALRKAPSICYYPMKTLFVYKGISMLTLSEIFKPE